MICLARWLSFFSFLVHRQTSITRFHKSPSPLLATGPYNIQHRQQLLHARHILSSLLSSTIAHGNRWWTHFYPCAKKSPVLSRSTITSDNGKNNVPNHPFAISNIKLRRLVFFYLSFTNILTHYNRTELLQNGSASHQVRRSFGIPFPPPHHTLHNSRSGARIHLPRAPTRDSQHDLRLLL